MFLRVFAGTSSMTIGATLAASCVGCPINSYSNAGFAMCQPCAAGNTYQIYVHVMSLHLKEFETL